MLDTAVLIVFICNVIGALAGRAVLTLRICKKQGKVQARESAPVRKWFEYAGQSVMFVFVLLILLKYSVPGALIFPIWFEAFLKVFGAALMSGCVALQLVAKNNLGANWTGAKKGATVREGPITCHGLYAHSRNPMYAASLGIGLSAVLMTQHILVLAAWLVMISYVIRVIKSEECLLLAVKGNEYREYCRTVPRFF